MVHPQIRNVLFLLAFWVFSPPGVFKDLSVFGKYTSDIIATDAKNNAAKTKCFGIPNHSGPLSLAICILSELALFVEVGVNAMPIAQIAAIVVNAFSLQV